MTQSGPVINRDRSAGRIEDDVVVRDDREVEVDERDVRRALRKQIARLERESSAIVANAFPYISLPEDSPMRGGVSAGPCLLGLAELERLRDRLAGQVQDLRSLAVERVEHERRARERLEGMKLEPGRYKFARLPVSDLGEGGCGAWHVRPRLGLIGMLAGWWHVKLSSGCPLPRGPRICATPVTRLAQRPSAFSD